MKETAVTTESLIEIMNHQLDIIDEKDKTIVDLQQKLDYMLRQKYASSSEKFPSNQPSLFEEDSDIETEEESKTETLTYTRKKRGNKNTPRMFFFLKFLSYTYFEFSLEVMYRSTSKAA